MLGLKGSPGGYGGLSATIDEGSWRAPLTDVESELCSLRSAVETSQRGLSQLEAKLASKLEVTCRRQVDDTLGGLGSMMDFRQTVTKLQSEQRRFTTELSRLPTAREVQGALQRHQESLEERLGERIGALEQSLSHQQQAAVERLEGRGGETWRSCLQRMATLEEKVVLQSDVSRIVDRVLGEVRKAGPQIFGQALSGPAAIGEVRKEMRRLESKVAGLEARVIGIAEDSTAEGRIWRASIAAKVETLERAMQDHSGRLAGEETTRAELQEMFQQSCEAAEAAAQRAQQMASEAASRAREVASEVMASMEESLTERLKLLSDEGRQRALNLEDQFKETNHRISLQESDLKRSKERTVQAEQELSQLTNRLASMRIDVDVQKERYKSQEEKLLEREAGQQDHTRLIQSLRSDLEAQGASMRALLEEHKKQVLRGPVGPGQVASPEASGAVRQYPGARPASIASIHSELKAPSDYLEQKALSSTSEAPVKAVAPVSESVPAKAVSPVASAVPKAVSPVASEIAAPKAVSPVASEIVAPKAVSPAETVAPKASPTGADPLARQVAPKGPPTVLRFRCPNWQKECDGTYDLVKDKVANDRPVWKMRGGERWLYLTTDKNWGVGGQREFDENFNCKNSYVFHPRTMGAPSPDLLPKGWMLFDGQAWCQDPEVQATALEEPGRGAEIAPQAAAVPSPAGQQTVAGLSSAVSSARSQGAMGIGQTVAGLSSGISSARSQALGGHAGKVQSVAGLSSSISSARSQVDGALLADAILSKESKVKEDDANSWDEEGGDARTFAHSF
eukprot:s787_g15.t1